MLTCHHIKQEADGGSDTFDNCIPLCPDCHAAVGAFNSHHSFGGTSYSPIELKRRRDDCYAQLKARTESIKSKLAQSPNLYPHNPSPSGTARFNYSSHNGFYRIGVGNSEFLTRWTKASNRSIHCYSDSTNVSVALARFGLSPNQIDKASALDYSSRVKSPRISQVIVLENHMSRYAALQIREIKDDTRDADEDLLVFDYRILENGSDDFSVT